MPKQPVSVTLERDNLLWLRARMRSLRRRSLSDMIDSLVAEAREQYGRKAAAPRSVVGTIRIAPDDPDLSGADAALREIFAQSMGSFGDEPDPHPPRRRPPRRKKAPRAARSARTSARSTRRG